MGSIRPHLLPSGLAAVATTELVDATGRIDHALLTRIEWVASGTDFDVEVFSKRRTGLELVTAAAVDGQGSVIGMDFRLHGVVLLRMRPN